VGLGYARTLLTCWRESHTQARGFIPLAWRRVLKAFRTTSPNRL